MHRTVKKIILNTFSPSHFVSMYLLLTNIHKKSRLFDYENKAVEQIQQTTKMKSKILTKFVQEN